MDLCEFKATLGYTRSKQKWIQMEVTPLIPVLGSHRPFIAALRGNIKWEETEAQNQTSVCRCPVLVEEDFSSGLAV